MMQTPHAGKNMQASFEELLPASMSVPLNKPHLEPVSDMQVEAFKSSLVGSLASLFSQLSMLFPLCCQL